MPLFLADMSIGRDYQSERKIMRKKILGFVIITAGALSFAINNNTPEIYIPPFVGAILTGVGAWLLFKKKPTA